MLKEFLVSSAIVAAIGALFVIKGATLNFAAGAFLILGMNMVFIGERGSDWNTWSGRLPTPLNIYSQWIGYIMWIVAAVCFVANLFRR